MKNEHRAVDTATYVQFQLADLIAHLDTELDYALPCYEDGTLSPRRSLQYIREKLIDLRRLVNRDPKYVLYGDVINNTLPPPATPEALE